MAAVAHEVRNTILDKPRTFTITPDGLSWRDAKGEGLLRYSDVRNVRLIAYPNTGGRQLQCTIRDASGRKHKIRSHHYVSLGNFENRSDTYQQLIQEFVKRAGAAGGEAEFTQGSPTGRALWSMLFFASLAIAVGYVFALIGGAEISLTAIAPLAVLIGVLPWSWSMMRAPYGAFDPNDPPRDYLQA